jgi:cysteine desulfurase
MSLIYFDHNSTTYLLEDVKIAMTDLMDMPYNSSSIHNYGRKAKYIIEESRRNILKLLNIKNNKYDIVFTSSGTEANNLIISNYKDKIVITSPIEHLSILNCAKLSQNSIFIKLQEDGLVNLNYLEDILKKNPSSNDILVSIMYANNETGIIEQIKEICNLCNKYNVRFHTDAVQAIGKIDLDIEGLNIDFLTLSAHKFGGPIGAALLLYKKDANLLPSIYGGGQEKNLRSGTENVIAIRGLEKALEITTKNSVVNIQKMKYLRDKLEENIILKSPNVNIIGKNLNRLPNTSNIIMSGVQSTKQLIEFDLRNIAVSSGSACSSGKVGKSHVLKAMNIDDKDIACSIRISLNHRNTEDEVNRFVEIWNEIYKVSI